MNENGSFQNKRQRGREAGPAPTADDPYEDEAYRLAIKRQGK